MHPSFKRLLTDTIRVASRVALDSVSPYYGEGEYATPVPVRCRVDRKPRRSVSNDGDTHTADATIICEEEIELTAKVWLPEDPASSAGRMVKASTPAYDERGLLHHYEITV